MYLCKYLADYEVCAIIYKYILSGLRDSKLWIYISLTIRSTEQTHLQIRIIGKQVFTLTYQHMHADRLQQNHWELEFLVER